MRTRIHGEQEYRENKNTRTGIQEEQEYRENKNTENTVIQGEQ